MYKQFLFSWILICLITYVVSLNTKQQYEDNIRWIKEANQNKLVSQFIYFNIRQLVVFFFFFFDNINRIQTISPSFDINHTRSQFIQKWFQMFWFFLQTGGRITSTHTLFGSERQKRNSYCIQWGGGKQET